MNLWWSSISFTLVFLIGYGFGQRRATGGGSSRLSYGRSRVPSSYGVSSYSAPASRLTMGPPGCVDDNRRCRSWAKDGGCRANFAFMATHCRKICGFCDSQGQTAKYNQEKKLRARVMSDYDLTVRPLKNNTDTIDVAVSFSLLHLMSVNEQQQSVKIQGYLKLKWCDSRLTWLPSDHGDLNRLAFKPSSIWTPQIMVVNTALADNTYLLRGNPTPVMVNNEGMMVWTPRVEATSLCNFDMKNYPVDKHTCSVTFGPWMQDGNLVNITIWQIDDEPDYADPYLHPNSQWSVVSKLRADDDFISPCCSEPWPVVHVDLKLQRLAPMVSAAVITPIVYVVATLLLCFLLPIRSVIRFLFSCGDCVILIFMLLHLSKAMPEASDSTPVIIQIIVALILESLMVMFYCGMLYQLSSPRCKVNLVKISPDFLKKLKWCLPTNHVHEHRLPDGSYNRLHESRQDLVDMFFGSDDQMTLLPPPANHKKPVDSSPDTPSQENQGNPSEPKTNGVNGDTTTEHPTTSHHHLVLILNRAGLAVFALVVTLELIILCFF